MSSTVRTRWRWSKRGRRTVTIGMVAVALLGLAACGGEKKEPADNAEAAAEQTGPGCEEVWAHTLTLIMQDPDMSAQWANLPEADRASRGARATAQCQTEQWSSAVRGCYAFAAGNADLAKCEALRGGGGPHASAVE